MGVFIDRTGETNIACNGMQMTIIRYKNSNDMDVQFDDGYIVKNKPYNSFKSGRIGHPDTMYGKKDRTGEEVTAKNGLKATIIKYNRVNDFDVQFEDGIIVHCKSYDNFRDGAIKHPNLSGQWKDRNGEQGVNKYGEKMHIIRYGGSSDIDIEFEDGTVVTNKTYDKFKKGIIYKHTKNFKDRVGEQSINTFGRKMKIIEYRNSDDIDIQFEDGAVVKHRTYNWFTKGRIEHPEDRISSDKRVGKQVINNGVLMVVKCYRSSTDVDLELEDGTILKHQNYKTFERGQISNKLFLDKVRIGEKSIASNGMEMMIISYHSYADIDVQFEDGSVRKNVGYVAFKRGNIMHPDTLAEINNRLGKSIKLKCGLEATIIEYKDANDVTIGLEDGTLFKKKFRQFTNKIKHSKYDKCQHVGTYNNEKLFICTCKKCKGKHVLKLSEMKDFECKE